MSDRSNPLTVAVLRDMLAKLGPAYDSRPVEIWLPGSRVRLSASIMPGRASVVLIEGNIVAGSALDSMASGEDKLEFQRRCEDEKNPVARLSSAAQTAYQHLRAGAIEVNERNRKQIEELVGVALAMIEKYGHARGERAMLVNEDGNVEFPHAPSTVRSRLTEIMTAGGLCAYERVNGSVVGFMTDEEMRAYSREGVVRVWRRKAGSADRGWWGRAPAETMKYAQADQFTRKGLAHSWRCGARFANEYADGKIHRFDTAEHADLNKNSYVSPFVRRWSLVRDAEDGWEGE